MDTTLLDKYKNPTWTSTTVTPQTFKPTPISSLGNSMTTSNIPTKTDLTSQYQNSTTGAITGAMTPPATQTTLSGAVIDVNGNLVTPPPQQKTQETPTTSAQQQPWYTELMNTIKGKPKPTSMVDQYNQIAESQGLSTNQKEVSDLQAQLNAINAEAQASQLSTIGQGRGIPQAIIGGQQAQLERERAIRALPIAAALNSSQGRLQAAQSNIETLLNLTQKDQEAQYKFNKDQIDYALKFADAAQQEELRKANAENEAKKAQLDQFNKTNQTYIDAAIKAGDYKTAGALASATSYEELARLAGNIQGNTLDDQMKALQIQKLRQDLAGGGSNQNELLSISDAKALGVPYGTTKGQAISKGITPGMGGGTSILAMASAKSNIDQTTSLLGDKYLTSAVGPNPLARTSFTNIFTGGKNNFIASVEQLRSQLSLDSLINAKERGATFGALSEGEMKILNQSASKIGAWAVKDGDGNVVGYKAGEQSFKDELDKINNFAKLDYLIKGGIPEDINATVMPDGSIWVTNSNGTLTKLK